MVVNSDEIKKNVVIVQILIDRTVFRLFLYMKNVIKVGEKKD